MVTTFHLISDALILPVAEEISRHPSTTAYDIFIERMSTLRDLSPFLQEPLSPLIFHPRRWIIRVNREPVKRDYVIQNGDEVLIGGKYVEYLPWKLVLLPVRDDESIRNDILYHYCSLPVAAPVRVAAQRWHGGADYYIPSVRPAGIYSYCGLEFPIPAPLVSAQQEARLNFVTR